MKRFLSLAACVMMLGVAGWSQAPAEYVAFMKGVSAANGSLRKNIEGKLGEAASADARKMAEIFGEVKAFFEKNNSAAAKIAGEAQAGFTKVAELAAAGKVDEAAEALKTAGANCGACHNAHREKAADGSWMIKF